MEVIADPVSTRNDETVLLTCATTVCPLVVIGDIDM